MLGVVMQRCIYALTCPVLAKASFDILAGLGRVVQATCKGAKSTGGHTRGILPEAPTDGATNLFMDALS